MLTIPAETKYAQPRMSPVDVIGAALVSLRKRAGLSQAAVEQRAGLSGGSLSRFERGDQHPRIETLGGILEALDADLYDLGCEARRASGRAIPETRNGGSEFTPDQLQRLDEEAQLTAYGLTVKHLRALRGRVEPDPEDLEP